MDGRFHQEDGRHDLKFPDHDAEGYDLDLQIDPWREGQRGDLPDIDQDFYTSSDSKKSKHCGHGLKSRLRKTFYGSINDIGWLQNESPAVEDETLRFGELLGQIRKNTHKLPRDLAYVLIPGLFSNLASMYFVDTKEHFSSLGLHCVIAKIDSQAGVESNSQVVKECIEEVLRKTGMRGVLLLGHSKGGLDAAAACSRHWANDLEKKVEGLVFAQSPYGGSPTASDLLSQGFWAKCGQIHVTEKIYTSKLFKGQMASLQDLTYDKRKEFVKENPLPPALTTISWSTKLSKALTLVSAMSQISLSCKDDTGAAANGPPKRRRVPIAAALTMSAMYLRTKYGEKTDGVVVPADAEVPGSVVVKHKRKMHHCWLVFPESKIKDGDPTAGEVCEALFTLLLETKEKRKKN